MQEEDGGGLMRSNRERFWPREHHQGTFDRERLEGNVGHVAWLGAVLARLLQTLQNKIPEEQVPTAGSSQ